MKKILKNFGFKYIKTFSNSIYTFNETYDEKEFNIAYSFTNYYIMKHNDNIKKIAELIKKLFENGNNLFYAEITQTSQSKFNSNIVLAILNPTITQFFQKTDIITKQLNTQQIKLFNFVPMEFFKRIECYYHNEVCLTIEKNKFNKISELKFNYNLIYFVVNKQEIRLIYDITSQQYNNDLKIKFINLLMPQFDEFFINFLDSSIEIQNFFENYNTLLINFEKLNYNSFNEFINDIFNNLVNCINFAALLTKFEELKNFKSPIIDNFNKLINNTNFPISATSFKSFEKLKHFKLSNETKKFFVELFEFILDYIKFKNF